MFGTIAMETANAKAHYLIMRGHSLKEMDGKQRKETVR